MENNKELKEILVSEKKIDEITTRLAAEIDREYAGSDKRLVLVCILKGSIMFMAELMKKITLPVEIDCMKVSSYGSGTTSTGSIHIILDLIRPDLEECNLLIIEDIIDSGYTLSYLTKFLLNKGAHSVKTCTMLDKPSRRVVNYEADFVGMVIPDEYVVGFGLDYRERYRALPYVAILDPSVYKKEK